MNATIPSKAVVVNDSTARYLLEETAISIAEAARLAPGDRGFASHISTVTRWILAGIRQQDGTRLKLEAIWFAGHWVTSVEAVNRFLEARNKGNAPQEPQYACN